MTDLDLAFEDVPAADVDAELDPHWTELNAGRQLLPAAYMPPPMAGHHGRSMRTVAMGLVAVFAFATVCGVCLTYGPLN